MRKLTLLLVPSLLAMLLGAPAAAGGGKARYSEPLKEMDAALDCVSIDKDVVRFGRGAAGLPKSPKVHPVLLVHGTGVNRELNWDWNYWRVLPQQGFPTCWVQLPDSSLVDIQRSAEYVARAVEVIHKATGSKVDVLGHSQGGLSPRWAIKWFPSGKHVDDYIALATPNHGTAVAEPSQNCFESCWQMKQSSRFIRALNEGDETPGKTSYTSIYTATDELVQPVGTQELEGASNILIQDICPGRAVDHLGIVGDAVAYTLVLDALTSKGGADPKKLPADICTSTTIPGMSFPPPQSFPPEWGGGHFTDKEPPLRPYAR
jgi:triacylglycerol esterase/lipase EstA (alpha/beta hydrolase family)